MRYALDLKPIGQTAKKQHDQIVKEKLGQSKARVELLVRSSKMNGRKFTIARRYGEDPIVMDDEGKPSAFTPLEILPGIELYGQNEIYEIAQSETGQSRLLARFLEEGANSDEARNQDVLKKLHENRLKLLAAKKSVADLEDEVSRIPKIEEQIQQFKNLGIEEKLKIIPQLEAEKRIIQRIVEQELDQLAYAFKAVYDNLPDTAFLSEQAIGALPHPTVFKDIREELNTLKSKAEVLLKEWESVHAASRETVMDSVVKLKSAIAADEESLENTFKELPTSEGKTGRQVGMEFQKLLKDIEQLRPKKNQIESLKELVLELALQRQSLLNEWSEIRSQRSARFERSLKKLNRTLRDKMRLTVRPEANRQPIIDFLKGCSMENVGGNRLGWVQEAEDFSPVKLAERIRKGASALQDAAWGITPTVADALARLSTENILQLEEIELPDQVRIELNTAHDGAENYRPLEKLSTGQQCTAILHLILLQNKDPLIVDQPEDNLDNAFIADRIVAELRSAKISRQFIFATHNANIPVFGDAEWIGVLEASEDLAKIPEESQGAIDVPDVKHNAANILEGGRTAFNQRKVKYGF